MRRFYLPLVLVLFPLGASAGELENSVEQSRILVGEGRGVPVSGSTWARLGLKEDAFTASAGRLRRARPLAPARPCYAERGFFERTLGDGLAAIGAVAGAALGIYGVVHGIGAHIAVSPFGHPLMNAAFHIPGLGWPPHGGGPMVHLPVLWKVLPALGSVDMGIVGWGVSMAVLGMLVATGTAGLGSAVGGAVGRSVGRGIDAVFRGIGRLFGR